MISFAQNQEDVVLSRLLGVVKDGTYIDVGAGHPRIHNVTYALYLAGWRGINVEPMAEEAELLRSERPEDVTFQVAAGATPGLVRLYVAPSENRGATTSDLTIADRYRTLGQVFNEVEVSVLPLDDIILTQDIHEVHVLKIDVEGAEEEVLQGFNFSRVKPWVLVIESTIPNSTEDASFRWEQNVLDKGYTMTLFDGLNKFFVRNDLGQIARMLSTPANVFDRWESRELAELREHLVDTTSYAQEYSSSLLARIAELEAYTSTLEILLNRSIGWLPHRSR